jgi:hypothetical protein
MNPFYRVAVSLSTITTIVVSAYDGGKTGKPPGSVVKVLLGATATSSSSPADLMTNAITGAIYFIDADRESKK